MGPIQTLAAILGLSAVSGINLYLTVLVLGLGQRLNWVQGLPSDLAVLAHPAVLIAAGLLFLLEFAADKIPFVTPLWDGLHTLIRPVGGALLALGAAGDLNPATQAVALLAGGTIALGTHGSKMGVRLLAHTAPEPTSHSVLSVAEDLGVVGLLALAYAHPYLALAVLAVLLVGTALLLPLLARSLVFVLTGFRGALRSLFSRGSRDELPPWVDLAVLDATAGAPLEALPCFARRVKGVPRLHRAYLVRVGGTWRLVYRRWFRVRGLDLDPAPGPVRLFRGLVWNQAVFLLKGRPQILLVGRDWRHALPEPRTHP